MSAADAQMDVQEGHIDAQAAAKWTESWLVPWKHARRAHANDFLKEPHRSQYLADLETASAAQMTKNFRARALLSCWSQAVSDDAWMWQEYAPGGLGVAVVSSIERVRAALDDSAFPERDGANFWCGLVRYPVEGTTILDDIEPDGLTATVGFLKRPEFQREREFRFLCMEMRRSECGSSMPVNLEILLDHTRSRPRPRRPTSRSSATL